MLLRDKIRITNQINACLGLGLSQAEHDTLRRASMTLHRWSEMECNHDVERDDITGKVTVRYCRNDGNITKPQRVADRETPALKRCEAIAKVHGLVFFHQSDPRGAAVYIGTKAQLGGLPADRAYNRLLCIY